MSWIFEREITCISFNRYMVECELRFISIILTAYRVLIDTWWNVNTNY